MIAIEQSQKSTGDIIRETIEGQSQRKTHAKNQIASKLAELADTKADFTIEGLWHDLQQFDPHIGRATVFRVVETLVDRGVINRIDFADGSHAFRACGNHHHHHLTCIQCHRVVEIKICIPQEQFDQISKQTDFVIEGHSLTIYGLCADCQKAVYTPPKLK